MLRWGQTAFRNFRVVPPDTGIVHQVNLEYLAPVVFTQKTHRAVRRIPDTRGGHGLAHHDDQRLGVVGWGVGGIEAEACMLGQPISMLLPAGGRLQVDRASCAEGATATDLVLTVTQMLRAKGVVGQVSSSSTAAGVSALSLADRATIANMAPEYGATIGFFPVDDQTLDYLRLTNRAAGADRAGRGVREGAGTFPDADDAPDPVYTDTLELDLSKVTPSLAGPKRPQDRIELPDVKKNFLTGLGEEPRKTVVNMDGKAAEVQDGAVVIAAITSCTNTSNPSVMLAAGLLAKKAVENAA